jgi:two-component system sensor kinase FixL
VEIGGSSDKVCQFVSEFADPRIAPARLASEGLYHQNTMNWVTIIWAMIASACLTLALVHLLVWWRRPEALADLFFALMAVGTAVLAGCELWMMRAETPIAYGTAVRWGHAPVWMLFVSLVGFVRLYLRAGRLWLAWMTCGLKTLSLILNFVFIPNLNYREITALRHVSFLGETVVVAEGVPNPWMLISQLSLLLLIIFVADAAISVWQRGDRRQALSVGGSIVFFVVAGTVQAILIFWGIIHAPITFSLFFMVVVAAMAYELSRNVFRAARLSDDLRDSEERMSLAAEAANLGMWVWDVARDEVWMTNKGRALLGFARDTRLNAAALISRVHPEDRAARAGAIKSAIETQGEYSTEYRVLLPDGMLRWIGARGHCIHVGDPKGIRLLGVSMDVTAQKLAQDTLRESEARFQAMADSAPVMIWMSGTDKLCTFFNKGWLNFTGRSLEQELGNGWAEGVHREDFDRCFEAYSNSFEARQPFTIEYRLRRSDGQYRWVLDNGLPRSASDGTFLGYIGSGIDITERKQAQDRFRLVVEASPNGIVLVDAQGHIVLVNACGERLFGYKREELIGQGVEVLVPERFRGNSLAHPAGFHAAMGAAAMGAGLELFARRKDGTEFPVEIGSSRIESQEGTLVLSVIVDISARRQAEAQTRQHREEIAHLSRVAIMGEMAGALAHELNQPLTGIVNNASAGRRFIAKGRADLAKLDSLFEAIVSDGRRGGEIIRGIRSMVRKGEEVRSPVNLNDVIARVLGFVRSDALERHCALVTEAYPALPLVEANQVQLQQVLLNLVVNAFEAMRETPAAERRVIIRSERDSNGRVRVSVRDFGAGLPTEEPRRIFERFFSTKREGMGMGLAIARSIIASHGGELDAANAQDGGACVHFSLPVIAER